MAADPQVIRVGARARWFSGRLSRLALASAMALALVGCGGGGDGDDDTTEDDPSLTPSELAAAIYSLNTSGAEGYLITGGEGAATTGVAVAGATLAGITTAVDLEPNSLYKVTADGTLERVAVEDEAGNELPRGSVQPFDVQDVNETFMVMWLYIPGSMGEWSAEEFYLGDVHSYLVRKSDGLAYEASDVINPHAIGGEGPYNAPTGMNDFNVVTDDNDNLFIPTYLEAPTEDGNTAVYLDGKVLRVDTSNLGGNLTAQTIQQVDRILGFVVPGNGEYVVYTGAPIDDPEQQVFRMVDLSNGALTNLQPLLGTTSPGLYPGIDGNIYALASGNLYRITRDLNGDPLATDLGVLGGEWVSGADWYPAGGFDGFPGGERLVVDGREFRVSEEKTVEVLLTRTDSSGNPAPLLRFHDAIETVLSQVREVRVSGQYVWYFGTAADTLKDTIVRYDPLSETTTRFAAEDATGAELDINKFRVLSSDQVLFEALRLSDQANVIGTIDGDGTVTVTDVVAADEPVIYVLEPVIPADFVMIDGKVRDWGLEHRVTTDDSGDGAPAGDDLAFYSQMTAGGLYLGLVEFNGAIDPAHRTNIRINNAYELQIDNGVAMFVEVGAEAGSEQALSEVGGEAAVMDAVEFRLPASALGSPTSYAVVIERVQDVDSESETILDTLTVN